jgi:hypothetical protein
MNEQQIKMLKRAVILSWVDRNVPTDIYSQLVDLLQTALSTEDFTLFLETHCQDH